MLIARLIADPAGLETHLDAALEQLRDQSMPVAMARMLDLDEPVLHLSLPDGDEDKLRAVIETHFAPSAAIIADADIVIPTLFVSDMDSTMIGQECIDELADYAGLKDKIAAITERAMLGELDFTSALKERVALLKGLPETAIQQCLDERISFNPGAKELVQTLKSKGCKTILVTGGFHHFADPVGAALGFDRVVGNRLAVEDGVLTGELDGPIVDSAAKRAVLEREVAAIDPQAISLAIGDGANDIPMIEAATYGFAYHAKPKARAAADGVIDDGDLAVVLSLLGISETDWVDA